MSRWVLVSNDRLIRKIDWRITSWCCLMFFALQLDRVNITQALSDNFLADNGLTTNDYNYGQTIFYLSFLLAEIPSQLVSKKIGPDNWYPPLHSSKSNRKDSDSDDPLEYRCNLSMSYQRSRKLLRHKISLGTH